MIARNYSTQDNPKNLSVYRINSEILLLFHKGHLYHIKGRTIEHIGVGTTENYLGQEVSFEDLNSSEMDSVAVVTSTFDVSSMIKSLEGILMELSPEYKNLKFNEKHFDLFQELFSFLKQQYIFTGEESYLATMGRFKVFFNHYFTEGKSNLIDEELEYMYERIQVIIEYISPLRSH